MSKQNVMASVLAAELVLFIPLIAMAFTDEVQWNLFDFIVASVLLAGLGLAGHLIVFGIRSKSKQAIIGIMLAAAMLLLWVELAVGIFGSPIAGS